MNEDVDGPWETSSFEPSILRNGVKVVVVELFSKSTLERGCRAGRFFESLARTEPRTLRIN